MELVFTIASEEHGKFSVDDIAINLRHFRRSKGQLVTLAEGGRGGRGDVEESELTETYFPENVCFQ